MYAVRCPHCKRILKLKRPVEQAKMKCRSCGGIFLGTTTQVAESAAAAATRPAAPAPAASDPAAELAAAGARASAHDPFGPAPPGRQPDEAAKPEEPLLRPRRQAQWPAIVVGAGVVGVIILVIVARYYFMHPRVQVREGDRKGPLIYDRRDIRGEHERHIQELKDQRENPAGARQAPPPPSPSVRPPPPGAPDVGPGSSAPPRAPPDSSTAQRAPPEAGPRGDPKITQLSAILEDRDAEIGASYLVGQIRSSYEHPLRSVRVEVMAYDNDGKMVAKGTFVCRYVPAAGEARFSVPCGSLTSDRCARVEVVATNAMPLGALEVCWAEESPMQCQRTGAGKVVVRGEARNPYDTEVENVRVHCDFFSEEGVHLGSAGGELEDGETAIPPGERRDFVVEFTGRSMITDPVVHVRVVGRKV